MRKTYKSSAIEETRRALIDSERWAMELSVLPLTQIAAAEPINMLDWNYGTHCAVRDWLREGGKYMPSVLFEYLNYIKDIDA